jgi:hypothetical protein
MPALGVPSQLLLHSLKRGETTRPGKALPFMQ